MVKLTVWEMACGDTEAVLKVASDEVYLYDLLPSHGRVIKALLDASTAAREVELGLGGVINKWEYAFE